MSKILNKVMVFLFSIPFIKSRWLQKYAAIRFEKVPWTPLQKPLSECKFSLVTTGGIHLKTDEPFNMENPAGDSSFREIPADVNSDDLQITHKYYNHSDADKDPNLVLPLEILRQLQTEGVVGSISETFFSFMGHIEEPELSILLKQTAVEAAQELKRQQVDVVLLVPA